MFVGVQPMNNLFSKSLREEKHNESPEKGCHPCHQQKTWERHSQETGRKISRQSRTWDHSAKNQNSNSASFKPAFAASNFVSKFPQRRSFEPAAPGVTGESVQSCITRPYAQEARRERCWPGNLTGRKQKTGTNSRDILQHKCCEK